MLPVKKIYCDTYYKRKDSKSTSNFKIDLPQTLKLPDNCVFYVDDVSIPNVFRTVETDINDKLYFRLQLANGGSINDYIITLDSKIYTGTQFATEIQLKITAITSGAATLVTYDTPTNMISVSVANLDINFFTNEELIDPVYNIGWSGTAYSSSISSGNELISNMSLPSPVGNTAIPAKYHIMLTPIRNIYMRSPNLSSFNTIAPDGSASVIKKIPVNSAPGQMILSNITSSIDYLSCSRATWKTLEIQLTNVKGEEIRLHGLDWSFSIVFSVANDDI
jgi:hypothetical protein